MIELYMLTEKYNISLNDKLQEKKKYKMKMKAINIYNYLFNQWLTTEKNKKVSNCEIVWVTDSVTSWLDCFSIFGHLQHHNSQGVYFLAK